LARLAPSLAGTAGRVQGSIVSRGFVEAHDGAPRDTRLWETSQHVFHGWHEADWPPARSPILLEMRLRMFFESPPHRIVAGAPTNVEFDDFCSRRRQAHLACQPGLAACPRQSVLPLRVAVEYLRGRRTIWVVFAGQHRFKPLLDQLVSLSADIAMLVSRASGDPCHSSHRQAADTSAFSRIPPSSTTARDACPRGSSPRVGSLFRAQPDNIFLIDGNFFRGHRITSVADCDNSEFRTPRQHTMPRATSSSGRRIMPLTLWIVYSGGHLGPTSFAPSKAAETL